MVQIRRSLYIEGVQGASGSCHRYVRLPPDPPQPNAPVVRRLSPIKAQFILLHRTYAAAYTETHRSAP